LTQVEFVKLKHPERARILCELAEEFYLHNMRVLILVQDENQGVTLDRFMWTWKKGAFIPHVYDNGSVDSHDEPVVIVDEQHNPNGADVLVMGTVCTLDFMKQFKHVVDFAETYDEERLEDSRERFREYRDHGFKPSMR
jgi:DNA polymerase-3 subunit chi